MMVPVDISQGYAPSMSDAGPAARVLRNWYRDAAGVNVPRPPLAARSLDGVNAGTTIIGAYEFKGDLIIVGSDRYIYRVLRTAPTEALALSTSDATTQLAGSERPTFAEDPSDVFIAGGGSIQKWTPGNPTTARLGAGPTISTHLAQIGQRLVSNDLATAATRNQFFFSDLGDGSDSTWGANSTQTAEARPDAVKAIYENTAELFVFGDSTLEVYSISPDPDIPFGRVNTMNVGLGAVYSPVRVDDVWYFLDDTFRFVRTDGHSQADASFSVPVEATVREFTNPTDCWSYRLREGRYDLVVFQFPSAQRALVYDHRADSWAEDAYYDTGTKLQTRPPIGAHAYWSALRKNIFGRSDTNGVAQPGTDGEDLGGPLLCERETGTTDLGTRKTKRSRRVQVAIKRGTEEVDVTPGVLEMRVRNDGGAWSKWKQRSIGNAGDDKRDHDFHFGGVFRERQYGIRYAGSTATALVSVHDDVEELDS